MSSIVVILKYLFHGKCADQFRAVEKCTKKPLLLSLSDSDIRQSVITNTLLLQLVI